MAVDVLDTLFQANRKQQPQHNGGDVNEELFPAIGSVASMEACSFGVSTISTASAVSEGRASLWMGSVSGIDFGYGAGLGCLLMPFRKKPIRVSV